MMNPLTASTDKALIDWTLRQLNPQPYQHLLEIGSGSGKMLAAAARSLRVGFVAGIESSVPLYRQAYRRNKLLIRQQRIQLHLGEPADLPYPAHYFHTIYGIDVHASWKDVDSECLRLASLLKIGGRLVLLTRPRGYRREKEAGMTAARLQAGFLSAGLNNIRSDYQEFATGVGLTVTAVKTDTPFPINNRLLNSASLFLSNTARMQI